jgi:hypothetical protein
VWKEDLYLSPLPYPFLLINHITHHTLHHATSKQQQTTKHCVGVVMDGEKLPCIAFAQAKGDIPGDAL